MNCEHCGNELTEAERASNEQTKRVHGVAFDRCQLCWDAWGKMTFGWQAGVPESKRVRYADRANDWKARRKVSE